jgi:hypothetical protein
MATNIADPEAIRLVRAHIKSWADLARRLTAAGQKISGQACRKWTRIPPERVRAVAAITGLSKEEIDPFRPRPKPRKPS